MNGYFIQRKATWRRGMIAMTLVLCASLLACGRIGNAPKTFSVSEMSITLTEQFKETPTDQYTARYDSAEASVMVVKRKFTALGKLQGCTLREYAQLMLETNRPDDSLTLQTQDGLTYFEQEHVQGDSQERYTYMVVIYESQKAFWMVQFITKTEKLGEYRPQFWTWAKSVTFSE